MAVQTRRRASCRLDLRLEARELSDIRHLAAAHRLPVSTYVVQCALGRLRPGVDELGELRARVERLEQQAQRGY